MCIKSSAQVVDVNMVSPDMCPKMLGRGLPWDEYAMVCAGGRDRDACQVCTAPHSEPSFF
jgi:hypothetical protein